MKKLLLMCCLLLVAGTMAFGQINPVSKPIFMDKVNQFSTLLQQNNISGANAVWSEINQMMMTELANIKYKIGDAAQNPTLKGQLLQLNKQQSTLYSGIIPLRSNMVQNQGQLTTKLNQFGNAIQ